MGTCELAESVNCVPEITTSDATNNDEGGVGDDVGEETIISETETTTTPSPTIIVSSTEDGAATADGMTNTPTTDLFETVTNAVEEDLNEAASLAAAESKTSSEEDKEVWIPDCTSTGEQSYTGNIVGPACTAYAICVSGIVAGAPVECTEGTLYNKILGVCDHETNVICYTSGGGGGGGEEEAGDEMENEENEEVEEDEINEEVEEEESNEEEEAEDTSTTPSPTTTTNVFFPTMPPETRSPSANNQLENALEYAKNDINNKLLIFSKTNSTGGEEWSSSLVYRYDDLLRALRLMYLEGVGDYKFYIGDSNADTDDSTLGTSMGLVNIAAFLAQSMKETIKYDACDENNWDVIDGKYPISNSCGQLNQTYQEYTCPADMEHMACEVDLNMEQVAYTNAKWYGAPGPLYCGPKSKYPVSCVCIFGL